MADERSRQVPSPAMAGRSNEDSRTHAGWLEPSPDGLWAGGDGSWDEDGAYGWGEDDSTPSARAQ